MARKKYVDPFPFKNIRNPQELEIRLRRLVDNDNDIRGYLDSFFDPTDSQKWAEGAVQVGAKLGGSSNFGILVKGSTPVVIGSDAAVVLRHGHYYDGENDRYIGTGGAYQLVLSRDGTLEGQTAPLYLRRSTGAPVKDGIVSWSADVSILPLSGSNSNGYWVRYPDGTQICSIRGFDTTAGATWTYPKPFTVIHSLQGSFNEVGGPYMFSLGFSAVSTTSATFFKKYFDGVSIGDSFTEWISLLALGRWY